MRGLVMILFGWLIGLTVLVSLQFLAVDRSRADARADGGAVWRAVVCTIEASEAKSPRLTEAQRASEVRFWTDLLVTKVHTAPCG